MKINRWMAAAAMAALLGLGVTSSLAQDTGNRGNRGNFDPAQFRQRMMDRMKEQLEVTDDTEWKALEPLVQKVMDARRDSMGGMGRGMMGPRRGGPGGDNTNADRNRPSMFGTPSPEAEALQKAIDGKASGAEMKAVIAKYVESRKTKQAELEKAQAELRKVLSVRQEAIATLNGLL